jgi:hypothetical protein
MANDKHPCGHAICECLIEGLEAFCSSYCAEAASAPTGTAEATCECGHLACSGENARTARLYDSIAKPHDDAAHHIRSRARHITGGNPDARS